MKVDLHTHTLASDGALTPRQLVDKAVEHRVNVLAITAALFLKEFAGDTPWAHLDIAGPAFTERDTPLSPKGGTGVAVRTLLAYLTAST